MEKSILDIALKCKSIRNNKISLVENVIPRRDLGVVFTDYDINGDIGMYERSLRALHNAIKEKYPAIGEQLRIHMNEYDSARIIHLSAVDAIVDCVIALEENLQTSKSISINHSSDDKKIASEKKARTSKRIFISHSSKDKKMVEKFTDHILQLGVGIDAKDIFCTSIEDLGIRNGEDIRKHIHENIKSADYSFLLISKNYKKSEICLNEMGAVWAYDSKVRLYLLPDVEFPEIGWLCDTRKAGKINEAMTLDSLYQEMTEHYSLPQNLSSWSRQRQTFLDHFTKA